jgi:DNA-binding transcriptional regulator YbjK
MWFDDLPSGKGWSSLWHHLSLCSCGAIQISDECSVCHVKPDYSPIEHVDDSGQMVFLPPAAMGAEGRHEDWLYLELIQREWLRPASAAAEGMLQHRQISERATVVLLFWTYFESRVERLLRLGLAQMREALCEDILARYSSVGARMDRLYKLVFGTTYFEDLRAVNAEPIVSLLAEVQKRRNEFAHGQPGAITDDLTNQVVAALREEHLAWIAVFNRRVAARRSDAASLALTSLLSGSFRER